MEEPKSEKEANSASGFEQAKQIAEMAERGEKIEDPNVRIDAPKASDLVKPETPESADPPPAA